MAKKLLFLLVLVVGLFSSLPNSEAVCTPLGTSTPNLNLCKPATGETGWAAALNYNWDTVDNNVSAIPVGTIMFYGGASPPTGWYACNGAAKNRTTDANLFAIYGTTYGAGDGSTTFNLPNASSRSIVIAGTGTFVSSTDFSNVDTATEQITLPTNTSLFDGTAVTFSTTGGAPGGLTNGNPYFVIRVSATVVKLASSLANAEAGTAINLTTQGSGTHSLTVAYSTRNLADVGGEEIHGMSVAELPSHTHTITPGGTQITSGAGAGLPGVSGSNTGSTGGGGVHNVMDPFLSLTCMLKR